MKPKNRKHEASEIMLFFPVQEIEESNTSQDGTGTLHTCVVRPGPKASSVSPALSGNE